MGKVNIRISIGLMNSESETEAHQAEVEALLLESGPRHTAGGLSVDGKSPLAGTIKEANVGGTAVRMMSRLGIRAIIDEAMRMACTKTKKETVEIALNELIADRKRKQILQYRGKLNWSVDLDEMRKT